jgi:hypothetical protein
MLLRADDVVFGGVAISLRRKIPVQREIAHLHCAQAQVSLTEIRFARNDI